MAAESGSDRTSPGRLAARDRGYLTHAFNTGRADYLRMAYCLALSLRCTQRGVSRLSVVVPDTQVVPEHYREVFDRVIVVEDRGDLVHDPNWRVDNYVRLYELSPYDETVTLDADMLFFDDVAAWWDLMRRHDLVPATAVTYRGEPIRYNPLRENLYRIGLPDLHNGFLYFRKCQAVRELFGVMRGFAADWAGTCQQYFGQPELFSSDCVLLLGLRATGREDAAVRAASGGIPRFIHMKACLQGWPEVPPTAREWRDHADHRFDQELSLSVAGVRIGDPFHYHVRDFVDDELLARYERRAGVAAVGGAR